MWARFLAALGLRGRIIGAVLVASVATLIVAAVALLGPLAHSLRNAELTTLRGEGTYSDGRHPDWVEFVDDITADLARRDFNVNAIAVDPAAAIKRP